jgi:DNA-binding CsgD family transcriptional regulator
MNVARSWGEQGLALARQVGEPRVLHLALRLLAAIPVVQHDWEAAESLYAEAIALARNQGAGWEWERGVSLHLLGWMRRMQGDAVRARPLLEEADRTLRATGDRLFVATNLGSLADVALREGHSDEARGYARESLELSGSLRSWPAFTRALDMFVNLAAAEGHFERAVRLAGAVSTMRQHGGMSTIARPEVVDNARHKIGPTRAAAIWAEGRSMALAEVVALCLSDCAEDSSLLTSARNTQRAGLTERELEVLQLIANGKSNREIASVLVLSTRTVERHIENLYAKIGANGRAGATAYAVRQRLA